MSERGWIKLHRQLQDNPLWLSEPFSRSQAWIDLMILANHKPGYVRVRGRRILVDVGCVARAQKTLAGRWQWSRGKVQRFLKELEIDGQIEQVTSHDFKVIKLCNYKHYQSTDSKNGSPDESRDGSRNGSHTRMVRSKEGGEWGEFFPAGENETARNSANINTETGEVEF